MDLNHFKLIEVSSHSKEIASFQEDRGRLLPADKFEISFDAQNHDYADDFVVWTSIEFLFAPMAKRFTSGQLDPVDWSSWGWRVGFRDIQSRTVYFLPFDKATQFTFGPYDLSPVIKDSLDPTDVWPWAMRIHIHFSDRLGKQQDYTSPIYRITPSAERKNHVTDFDPTIPELP